LEGFNNNYAPVSIGPDGAAYVGVLGGLLLVRDATPPTTQETRPKLKVRARRHGKRVRVRVRARSGGVLARVRGAKVRVGKHTATTGRRGRARIKSKGRRAVATKTGYRRGKAKVKH
jgi:alkanesulfonate monooxygenase SsuD/methylene tetrahydromethanopterin reductase-like flavin-dependent oxidoreductase (luciferase family)